MTERVRFAVMGTGRITRRLVADLQSTPGVTVEVIGSRDLARAQWCGGQYGIAKVVGSYDELLADPAVDAVYIALPPALHARWCRRAADAGKHVLCEKPLAMNLAEAVDLAAHCRARAVRWLDATAWLHHQRTAAMTERLRNGGLGRLRQITAAMSFYHPFQAGDHRLDSSLGGGCLLDLGWYVAGCAILAAGTPRRLWAHCRSDNGVVMQVDAMLWFDDQVTAQIQCSFDTATRKWFEWAGEQASLVCDDFTRPRLDRPTRFWLHHRAGESETVTVTPTELDGSQERAMIAKLASDDDLGRFHQQALQTQAVLDAIARSSQTRAVETVEPIRCD